MKGKANQARELLFEEERKFYFIYFLAISFFTLWIFKVCSKVFNSFAAV